MPLLAMCESVRKTSRGRLISTTARVDSYHNHNARKVRSLVKI